jgi:hypothetical protein
MLSGTLTVNNGTAFNDYFTGFTYGSTLSFQASLDGPALSSPDGISSSGSTFAFSMFSDAAGTIPALTTNTAAGFAFTIDVNLDGMTTVTNYSAPTAVVPISTAIPEPSTLALLGIGVIGLGVMRRRAGVRRSPTSSPAGALPGHYNRVAGCGSSLGRGLRLSLRH